MAIDMTSADFALKEHYKAMKPTDMVYKNNPFYALVPKYTKFTGDIMPVPQIYANPQTDRQHFQMLSMALGTLKGLS